MRSKITYIAAVIFQIVILFLFINAETSVFKSPDRLVSETKMVELQRFTNTQTIHLSYPMNEFSSMNCDFEAGHYALHHPVYVKIQKSETGIKPIFFGTTQPELADNEVLLKGKIEAVSSGKLYIFEYETKGKKYQTKWMGRLRDAKKGNPAMLALDPTDPAKIEYVSEWKKYQTRAPGKIVRINQSVMNGQRIYQLMINFEKQNKNIAGQYIQFVSEMAQPPVLGATVEVSFDEVTNKILFVNFNPLVKCVIADIKTGYNIKASYGIENFNLQADQKTQLNELIDKYGESQVTVELAVNESGNSALTGIFISGQKVALD